MQYVRDGSRIWILPGSPEHKTWWRNLRGGADVDLLVAGQNMRGHAKAIDPGQQPEFAEGLAAYLRAVPQARRALGLPKHGSLSPFGSGVRPAGDSTVLIRVDLSALSAASGVRSAIRP